MLAFYYAWYDEKTWTPDKVPDMPVTPYRSADRATIERTIEGTDCIADSFPGFVPTLASLGASIR